MWELAEQDEARVLADRFARNWAREATKKSPSMLRALHRTFGRRFYIAGVPKLVHDWLQFAKPLLLHATITFVSSPTDSLLYGMGVLLGMLLSSTLATLLINYYFHQVLRTGAQLRQALRDRVFAKSLTLSNIERAGIEVGKVTNLVSNDVEKLVEETQWLHLVWSAPMQIVVVMFMLIRYIELIPALGGVIVLIITAPMNVKLSKEMGKYRKEYMKGADKRMKGLTEVVNGIRVVKFFAWENHYVDHLDGFRGEELSSLRTMVWWQQIMSIMFNLMPLLVTLVSFGLYTFLGHTLDAQTAFASYTLFNMLRFPLLLLPKLIADYTSVRVALVRIKDFLLTADSVDYVQHTSADSKVAVRAENASFNWGSASRNGGDSGHDSDGEGLLGHHDDEAEDRARGEATLKNISLEVQKGQLVMVVGAVGSGKQPVSA